MKNFEVIRESKKFSRLYKNSKKEFNTNLVLFYKEGDKNEVGFTASKKIGNAVKRNFAKRRLRALFLELNSFLNSGSYILIARDKILISKYKDIKKGFLVSLRRIKALKKNKLL